MVIIFDFESNVSGSNPDAPASFNVSMAERSKATVCKTEG